MSLVQRCVEMSVELGLCKPRRPTSFCHLVATLAFANSHHLDLLRPDISQSNVRRHV